MDIRVLGTQFNVKSYANDKLAEASLIHGSIEVSLKKKGFEKFVLKPNWKITVSNDSIAAVKNPTVVKPEIRESPIAIQPLNYNEKDSAIIETSWIENKLIFRAEPFEDIAIKLERWYGMEFRFEEPKLKSERLTGTFTTETLDSALHALQMTTAFKYRIKDNTVFITK